MGKGCPRWPTKETFQEMGWGPKLESVVEVPAYDETRYWKGKRKHGTKEEPRKTKGNQNRRIDGNSPVPVRFLAIDINVKVNTC